jgi:hypothetical protein
LISQIVQQGFCHLGGSTLVDLTKGRRESESGLRNRIKAGDTYSGSLFSSTETSITESYVHTLQSTMFWTCTQPGKHDLENKN